MNRIKWQDCCASALALFNNVGIETITNSRTIMRWYVHFRTYGTLTPLKSIETKEFEPKLFSVYPECKVNINKYFSNNLENINVDTFRSYVLDVIFPSIIDEANSSASETSEPLDMSTLLSSIDLKSLGLATSYKYLRHLGYRFDNTKKSYYNDGHERPEQIEYRRTFIKEYFQNELLCYVWVQVTDEIAITLENKEGEFLLKDIGYDYVVNGVNMREYHIDCHKSLQQCVHESNKEFGGNLSVRKPDNSNPCICIGEDESAYSQFAFSSKTWKGPNGEETLQPKGEGETLMVAAFCSRTFGLGRVISEENLLKINQYRAEKGHCIRQKMKQWKFTAL
jgi:hypothetical protein